MKKIQYICLAITLSFVSCGDWFDVAPKDQDIDEGTLFSGESAFRNAMNGIYTQLRDNSLYGSTLTLGGIEFLGQSLVPDESLIEWTNYNYETDSSKKMIAEVWTGLYSAIYSCNNLLQLFESKQDLVFVEGSREVMMAELKALRAFLHYDLLRLFHPAYSVDKNFKGIYWMSSTREGSGERLSSEEILKHILKDLNDALVDLAAFDPIVTRNSLNTSALKGMRVEDRIWKMNYYAALGIKARVCMDLNTTEAYKDALEASEIIIESELYPFMVVITTDLAFSTEHLFTLSSDNSGFTNLSVDLFQNRKIKMAEHLKLADVKTKYPDEKRLKWYDSSLNYMSPKFGTSSKVSKWGTQQGIPVIKVGEIYLIAAEAAIKAGMDKAVGFDYLQTFLSKRFFGTQLTSSSSEEAILNEIANQYRYEFVGEGQLFFFFKRLNQNKVTKYDGSEISMSNNQYLLPMNNW